MECELCDAADGFIVFNSMSSINRMWTDLYGWIFLEWRNMWLKYMNWKTALNSKLQGLIGQVNLASLVE